MSDANPFAALAEKKKPASGQSTGKPAATTSKPNGQGDKKKKKSRNSGGSSSEGGSSRHSDPNRGHHDHEETERSPRAPRREELEELIRPDDEISKPPPPAKYNDSSDEKEGPPFHSFTSTSMGSLPGYSVLINPIARCTDGERTTLRSLHELLKEGTAHIGTEAATPVLGPSATKPASLSPQQRAGMFSLDSVTTPNTFHALSIGELPPPMPSEDTYHFLLKDYKADTDSFSWHTTLEGRVQFTERVESLCRAVTDVLKASPLFVTVEAPVFVLGDIHGNFGDLSFFLRHILVMNDIHLTPGNVMCLGDYVDRGPHSLECVLLLLALKLEGPHKVFLLRGNHEDRIVCGDRRTYGSDSFLAQCHTKLGVVNGMKVFRHITRLFSYLPVAGEIDVPLARQKILCTHGGIPRFTEHPLELDKLALLRSGDFPRFLTLFPNNPMAQDDSDPDEEYRKAHEKDMDVKSCWYTMFDLLWSDPTLDEAHEDLDRAGFGRNARGDTVLSFSSRAVEAFLTAHGYTMLFRAHQEKAHGLRISKSSKVLTLFTSSNYQGHGNGAGCAVVSTKGEVQLIIKA